MIKKSLKYTILSLLVSASTCVFAEDSSNVKASVEAGYTSSYTVNGLSKTGSEAFAGFDIGSTYYGVDAYLGGTALTSGSGLGDVHLKVGLGKDFGISFLDKFSARVDALAFQHQTAASANSTEARLKLAINNPYVTPYVSGIYDVTLHQSGYILGLQKTVSIFGWFDLTPAVEYGKLSDYDTTAIKLGVSRTLFNHVQLFGEFAWVDNNFDPSKYNFANKEFNGDLVGTAGVRWKF